MPSAELKRKYRKVSTIEKASNGWQDESEISSKQAYVLEKQGRIMELVDPDLSSNYSKEEALQMLNLCLSCTNQCVTLRPSMSMVVSMLEGKTPVRFPTMNSATSKGEEIRSRVL